MGKIEESKCKSGFWYLPYQKSPLINTRSRKQRAIRIRIDYLFEAMIKLEDSCKNRKSNTKKYPTVDPC